MTTRLLTIGIPTYNRAHRIGQTLDSVLKQLPQELVGQVDILVSDNASTDETAALIQSYQAKHAVRISYSRNKKNLGYDHNVDMLFKKAEGQYVWTLADDDVLKESAIKRVLTLLIEHPELKAIMVNFDAYDEQIEFIQHKMCVPEKLFTEPESFLLLAASRYSLLSTLILDKDEWNQADLTKGFGSNFIHVYALFKLLLRGPSYIIGSPLVNFRQGSTNFTTNGDDSLSIGLSACNVVAMMEDMGYNRKIVKELLNKSRRYIYGLVSDAKNTGIKNKPDATRKLLLVYRNPTVYFKLLPIIWCPDFIYKPAFRFKKKVSMKLRAIKALVSNSKCNTLPGVECCDEDPNKTNSSEH